MCHRLKLAGLALKETSSAIKHHPSSSLQCRWFRSCKDSIGNRRPSVAATSVGPLSAVEHTSALPSAHNGRTWATIMATSSFFREADIASPDLVLPRSAKPCSLAHRRSVPAKRRLMRSAHWGAYGNRCATLLNERANEINRSAIPRGPKLVERGAT